MHELFNLIKNMLRIPTIMMLFFGLDYVWSYLQAKFGFEVDKPCLAAIVITFAIGMPSIIANTFTDKPVEQIDPTIAFSDEYINQEVINTINQLTNIKTDSIKDTAKVFLKSFPELIALSDTNILKK